MDPTAQLIAVAISIIAAFGAFGAWIVRHMDRRFAEAKADTQRQFDEAKADTQRQFAEAKADTQRQFDEAKADTQRQFDEAKTDTQRQLGEAKAGTQRQFGEMQRQFDELRADMQRGFDQAREDRLRLERKMEDKFDAQGDQIANLRQDVGRLQGIVERTYQPRRFTVLPAQQEVGAGDEVREPRMGYDTGYGGEDLGHGREGSEYGDEDSRHGSQNAGRDDES